MRPSLLPGLLLATACAGALYAKYAGPAASPPDQVYTCVRTQLKTMGYERTQYDEHTGWYVAEKAERNLVSSGLYRKTVHVLDVRVKPAGENQATLEITAHTYDEFANVKGADRQERKAADRVTLDAQTLGQACTTGNAAP